MMPFIPMTNIPFIIQCVLKKASNLKSNQNGRLHLTELSMTFTKIVLVQTFGISLKI